MGLQIAERQELKRFDEGLRTFRSSMRAVPEAALSYLRPGDDYSLGGLMFHINVTLEHYINVLDAIQDAEFGEVRPTDPPGLYEDAGRRAWGSLSRAELEDQLARMELLHGAVLSRVQAMAADFERKAPVLYGEAVEPYPSSPSDVVGWLSDHYFEHVPHAWELAAEWTTLQVIDAFGEAFNAHDVDGVMALMTDDCVFENTGPAPDGQLHEGAAAVRRVWEELFASTPSARFTTEEAVATGNRAVTRWRYDWDGGHIRGADVFRVRDGKVAEKLSYVKG
jgi:ketosteroid isomerase-like protein